MRRHVLRRARRGYSLPEVLIASALLALLLLGTLRWAGGLVGVSATHADLTRPRITARFVAEQFRTDVGGATVCHPAGIGGVVHAIDDVRLAVYRDDDGDGDHDLVWWRFDEAAGTLERAVVAGTGDCEFPAEEPDSGWAVLAGNVVPAASSPAITGIGGPAPGHTGPCTGLHAEACLFHALRLQLVPTSPTAGFPAPADVTVTLDLTGSRL